MGLKEIRDLETYTNNICPLLNYIFYCTDDIVLLAESPTDLENSITYGN